MVGKRKKRKSRENPRPSIEVGGLRFSVERIEKIHDGKRVTSFARRGVRWIRLARDSASEHPLREFLWAVGAGAGGVFLVLRGLPLSKTSEVTAGAVLSLISCSWSSTCSSE